MEQESVRWKWFWWSKTSSFIIIIQVLFAVFIWWEFYKFRLPPISTS